MRKMMGVLTISALAAVAVWAADIKAGQKSYEEECKDCHQMNGAVVSSVGKSMQKQGVTMRDLRAPEVQSKTDDVWRKQITQGVGKMKAVKTLSAADVDSVIAYMRTLKK